jgi:hypothetical protein
MTRQFHAHAGRRGWVHTRAARAYTLSFRCYRLVPTEGTGLEYELVELCDPRNAMRVFVR